MALEEYDAAYPFSLDYYMSEEIKLATVDGLIHHLNELENNNISIDAFIQWASWCNVGCENVSGEFENLNIEYFCTIFILKHEAALESKNFIKNIRQIIKNTNSCTYGEFIIQIHLLIEKEYKSFYHFFKSFLENKKTKSDIKAYVKSKYDYNLPYFRYDFKIFPYYDKLMEIKNNHNSIDDFINSIKFDNQDIII